MVLAIRADTEREYTYILLVLGWKPAKFKIPVAFLADVAFLRRFTLFPALQPTFFETCPTTKT